MKLTLILALLIQVVLFSCGKNKTQLPQENGINYDAESDRKTQAELAVMNLEADKLGIIQMDDFKNYSPSHRHFILGNFIREAKKIPKKVDSVLKETDLKKIYLVMDSIVKHPMLSHLSGKKLPPKAGYNKNTYDGIQAATLEWGIVIAANEFYSQDLAGVLLHEVGHLYERALSKKNGSPQFPISKGEEFLSLYQRNSWKNDYHKHNPEEAFAHCFEEFFHSEETRENLRNEMPDINNFIEDLNLDERQE